MGKKNQVTVTHFDPVAKANTKAAAIEAAGGDDTRLVEINPYTVVVVNYANFPTDRWTRKLWRQP